MKKKLDIQVNHLDYQGMLEAIFLATQDAISVVNEKGEHIMVNPAYTKITGIKYNDIIGKDALYDIEQGSSLHLKVLSTKKPVENTKLKIKPSGKTVVAQAAPIIVDNVIKGSVAILHDISGIKNLTDKLEEAEKKIRELTYKYKPEDIIGESENIQEVKRLVMKAAQVRATVLLRGESGTGKELFANSIHAQSDRKNNSFIRVNCAAITETLLESELFGYEEGAFTGAKKGGKKGLFEEADKGTIFLDEISEISMNTQVKLLRVLQEKEIMKVGGTKPISIDVRIIAATNSDLRQAVKDGKFREDLFYRLNILPIYIPPLRERKKDISLLIKRFIVKINDEYGRNIVNIDDEATNILLHYNWPGNVRELENVIGRSIINMNFNEQIIMAEHLPHLYPSNKKIKQGLVINNIDYIQKLSSIMEETESEYIRSVYLKLEKNKTHTAKKLGISVRTLYYKMEKYGIVD
ncbi:sigma-54 interaction domain-containing protein [Sedimentibacter sp. MB31-C6]|uniref:sigma-54 interaction domain-containing protein n=1 Tax=Sedimentibacter sp. MB31-C6 TaxID=3109366 RepID=UPI002DDCDE8A|nr:sigma 54-interacting transcriptional regulator [Sedimentibacter sp. MB36-C1]WSI04059.1 sigma 54-interacting transcriptional regulator [Sedimentibacter sp. MB36-C1]